MKHIMTLRHCLRGVLVIMLAQMTTGAMAADTVRVGVSGQVAHAATFELPAGAKFSDAVLAAMPGDDAYVLGASVTRLQARDAQVRLKAGLLHDLDTLASHEALPRAVTLAAGTLRAEVEALPVTGRVTAPLEPRRLEIDGAVNDVLAYGDQFVFPSRPDTVRVVGVVGRQCELSHVPLRDAADYLRDCARGPAADLDTLYVIQPDGQVQEVAVALWNRGPEQALAPGAVIYVPLDQRRVGPIAPRVNRELAAFLATQPLPWERAR